jgi:pimeloyl-ACP methyl ester carboxylesterase
LWQLWSPNWKFDDATYERTAKSFDNPDFVDIVIHSYRHRYVRPRRSRSGTGRAASRRNSQISVPTIALYGGGDGVSGTPNPQAQARFFSGPITHRVIPMIGHDTPQEAPAAVAAAVLELVSAPGAGDRRGG